MSIRRRENGTYVVQVEGSPTGTYRIWAGLRLGYESEEIRSMDATEFLPTGSTVVGINTCKDFVYTVDKMVLRESSHD